MIEHLLSAPLTFWLAVALLAALMFECFQKWQTPWAKPTLVVYATIGVWYLGDFALSLRDEYRIYDPAIVELAFVQVAAFLLILRILVSGFTHRMNTTAGSANQQPAISNSTLGRILIKLAAAWFVLLITAVVLHDGIWLPMLWPPAAREKVGMFVHPGVGSGAAFLLAAAGYIHVLICSMFGPIALLGRGKVRLGALVMIALSWPYFFFDRVRNVMLAMLLPAVASYWVFGRQRVAIKVINSGVCLLILGFWFQLVMAYRSSGNYDLGAFSTATQGASAVDGLDMMKELCWINTFIEGGAYEINWGQRYLGEALNFVPRTFWPGKPMVGWDYAVARGFGRSDGAINATIATGMIGQGVVNFGPYLGVVAAAAIMAGWVRLLAGFGLPNASVARRFLFALGLGLTFNMGRDITLLVLFPFVFGYIGVRLYENFGKPTGRTAALAQRRRVSQGPPPR